MRIYDSVSVEELTVTVYHERVLHTCPNKWLSARFATDLQNAQQPAVVVLPSVQPRVLRSIIKQQLDGHQPIIIFMNTESASDPTQRPASSSHALTNQAICAYTDCICVRLRYNIARILNILQIGHATIPVVTRHICGCYRQKSSHCENHNKILCASVPIN